MPVPSPHATGITREATIRRARAAVRPAGASARESRLFRSGGKPGAWPASGVGIEQTVVPVGISPANQLRGWPYRSLAQHPWNPLWFSIGGRRAGRGLRPPRRESNPHSRFRRPVLCPLSYGVESAAMVRGTAAVYPPPRSWPPLCRSHCRHACPAGVNARHRAPPRVAARGGDGRAPPPIPAILPSIHRDPTTAAMPSHRPTA